MPYSHTLLEYDYQFSEVKKISNFRRKFISAWSDHRGQELRFPGLRILKTSLAVFICLMIYTVLPENLNSVTACIAAVIVLKTSLKDSYIATFVRLQSTLVGAIFGLFILQIKEWLQLDYNTLAYNFILALFVSLVIWISVSFLRSDGAVLGSIVLLAIAIGPIQDMSPLSAALSRFIDTVIGAGIAIAVNILLPFWPVNKKAAKDTIDTDTKGEK